MKQVKKTPQTIKPFLTLSGKSTAGWGGLILFIFVLMFTLGTLVGRGSINVDLNQMKLENNINKYADTLSSVKNENIEVIDDTPDLHFYETLQKEEPQKKKKYKPKIRPKTKKVIKRKKVAYKPAKAKKTRPEKKPAPVPEKSSLLKYSIQVASFKGLPEAKEAVKRFRKKGFQAYTVKAVVRENETWYRVRIGAFKDRVDAKSTLQQLKRNNIDGFLVTR